MNEKLLTKMLEHTLKLYDKHKTDKLLFGSSYIEFGERSLIIVNPKNVEILSTIGKPYGQSIFESNKKTWSKK